MPDAGMTYPETRTGDAVVTLSGIPFADPYLWLEADTPEVRQWQLEQAQLASTQVRAWPHYPRLRQVVQHYSTERYVALPRYAAGRWFRTSVARGAAQAHVLTSELPMGEGRVLFDPQREKPDCPPFISWIAPSPDGRTLALGVCTDGSENNRIRLIDVASGQPLPRSPMQLLMDGWTGGVHWLPDSSGFFFSALAGKAIDFEQRVYLHRRRPEPLTVALDIPWTRTDDYRMVLVARNGRSAVALEGLTTLLPVAVASLEHEPMRWQPFVTTLDGIVAGHVVGNRYIAITNVGAARGRVVAIPLDSPEPNDPDNWEDLVPESSATLRTVTPVGELIYLTELINAYSHVRIIDCRGQQLGEVPLPGRGAVGEGPFPLMNLLPRGHPNRFLFSFSSLTVSPGIYSHSPGQEQIETLREPQVRLEKAIVEDHSAVSKDGARVPYHIVRRHDADASLPQPSLVYAYGGFNVPFLPQFPGPMAAIVAAGGIFVQAHLRGGGEFGFNWWQDGVKRNKQNSYDDLFAVAEDLIAARRTTPQILAVTGHSNGGLMAGVALTQRPDLWAVAVPRVPVLDLIGGGLDSYGRMATLLDRADIENPEEVRRLASFSPYHLVRDGVRYPAVYLDAGDTDPRCPPWHARKLAARLQKASVGAPVLLHVWENVGHGWATDKDIAQSQNTEWLAFVMQQIGLVPEEWP